MRGARFFDLERPGALIWGMRHCPINLSSERQCWSKVDKTLLALQQQMINLGVDSWAVHMPIGFGFYKVCTHE
jgi:hypothetical protein